MSCLFRALGLQVGVETQLLRQQIANYLEADLPLTPAEEQGPLRTFVLGEMDGTARATPAGYLRWVRQPSSWGGELEIQAFCELYKLSVRVRAQNYQRLHQPRYHPSRGLLTLDFAGAHYEPGNLGLRASWQSPWVRVRSASDTARL